MIFDGSSEKVTLEEKEMPCPEALLFGRSQTTSSLVEDERSTYLLHCRICEPFLQLVLYILSLQ